MLFLKVLLLQSFMEIVICNCDFYQYVEQGKYYSIHGPNNYSHGAPDCRWRAQTKEGNILKLSCGPNNIPQSSGCDVGRVRVSLSGDDTLSDGYSYCGNDSFSVVSISNKLTMAFNTSRESKRGIFSCNITSLTSSDTCNCGWKKQTRIVGGTETGVNEYPMMAGIVDLNKRTLYCGGTIIGQYNVLTAAHCLTTKTVNDITVLVGEHDISTGTDTASAKLYSVSSFLIHPDFENQTQSNDIGLVKVYGPITMSDAVFPVCLPFLYSQYDFSDAIVTVLGWGSTEFGGPTSNVLLEANLKVISPSACSAAFGDSVSYKQMCTYADGKDACQSDSGGPVLWQNSADQRLHLIGIISYGVACATDAPGVNTRVSSYLSWIYYNSLEESYCYV